MKLGEALFAIFVMPLGWIGMAIFFAGLHWALH